jgi:exopolysaccharide biosynthesis polyprenyl glycosylphosphotransferase
MNRNIQVLKYLFFDVAATIMAWTSFYGFRKRYIESEKFGVSVPIEFDRKFFLGLTAITIFWISLYVVTGTYNNIYRKSRLKELGQTLVISLIGVLMIFFSLLLNDVIVSYKTYYESILVLFCLQFFLTASFRLILSSITNHRIHSRIIGFNTILIGSNENALKLFNEMDSQKKSWGNKFVGFVHVDETNGYSAQLREKLSHLGEIEEVRNIIAHYEVEEAIIAIESSEHRNIQKIVNELSDTTVIIKIIPDMYDILSGQVKMTSIFGAPLIEVSKSIMPAWESSAKRMMDIFISVIAMLIGSPVYLFLAIGVKLSSKGKIFYSHERIGIHGKPFYIHKFRSMYIDAEKAGPALSSQDDPRITPFGRFMRKVRLDELPQFYNVLIGEMSVVGPRPERQFFINQILEKAPHYRHLHKVKPGITSWGQVKYGYAENVDQMIERLKYDLLYIENMSIYVDLKILIYTVLIVLQGRGK